MNITNIFLIDTINTAQYMTCFILENGNRFIKYVPDAMRFAKEGDIGGLAHRSFELLTSFDTPVYGVITFLALYQMGFFGSAREKLGCAMYGGSPSLLKLALLLRIVDPKNVIRQNIICNNPESLKIALDAFPPSSDELNGCFLGACLQGSLQALQILFQKGASLEAKCTMLGTPILLASARANKDAVQFLYENGADHLTVSDEGQNVLHYACAGANEDVLPYLLSLPRIKEKINEKDNDGHTPLFYLGHKVEKLGALMIQNGADIAIPDSQGLTLLDMACFQGGMEAMIYYARKGLKFHLSGSLPAAYGSGTAFWAMHKNEVILPLIDEKVLSLFYIDSSTKDSLFHFAARDGRVDLLKGLLRRLPKLNTTDFLMQREMGSRTASGHLRVSAMRNKKGRTVFQEAIKNAKNPAFGAEERVRALKIIKVLLEASIQPDREALEAARGDAELERLFQLRPSA